MTQIGRYEVHPVPAGRFCLDGGAMFGVVPKVLWEKTNRPDERNRIPMRTNCLLIIGEGRTILIDTGCGTRWDERSQDRFGIEMEDRLGRRLGALGIGAEQVTDVILTHLHFDHAGGNTRKNADGQLVPVFPNATYHVQRSNLDEATHPLELNQASYRRGDWEPVMQANQLNLLMGNEELFPGIKVLVTGGHARGHQVVIVEDSDEGLVFLGDIVPTTSHIKAPWVMGYDLYPTETLRWKKELLGQAFEQDWICVFEHDPVVSWGRLEEPGAGRFTVQPLPESH